MAQLWTLAEQILPWKKANDHSVSLALEAQLAALSPGLGLNGFCIRRSKATTCYGLSQASI